MRALSSIGMIVFIIIAALAILFAANATYAQEATEAPLPAVDVTEVVQPPIVTIDPSTVVMSVGTLIGVVAAAIVVGGATVGSLMLLAIRFVRQNVPIQDFIEALYKSTPVDTQNIIRGSVNVAKEAVQLADVVTDGQPNAVG